MLAQEEQAADRLVDAGTMMERGSMHVGIGAVVALILLIIGGIFQRAQRPQL